MFMHTAGGTSLVLTMIFDRVAHAMSAGLDQASAPTRLLQISFEYSSKPDEQYADSTEALMSLTEKAVAADPLKCGSIRRPTLSAVSDQQIVGMPVCGSSSCERGSGTWM